MAETRTIFTIRQPYHGSTSVYKVPADSAATFGKDTPVADIRYESAYDPPTGLKKVYREALAVAGILTLEDLSVRSETEVHKVVGARAEQAHTFLREALKAADLTYAENDTGLAVVPSFVTRVRGDIVTRIQAVATETGQNVETVFSTLLEANTPYLDSSLDTYVRDYKLARARTLLEEARVLSERAALLREEAYTGENPRAYEAESSILSSPPFGRLEEVRLTEETHRLQG